MLTDHILVEIGFHVPWLELQMPAQIGVMRLSPIPFHGRRHGVGEMLAGIAEALPHEILEFLLNVFR